MLWLRRPRCARSLPPAERRSPVPAPNDGASVSVRLTESGQFVEDRGRLEDVVRLLLNYEGQTPVIVEVATNGGRGQTRDSLCEGRPPATNSGRNWRTSLAPKTCQSLRWPTQRDHPPLRLLVPSPSSCRIPLRHPGPRPRPGTTPSSPRTPMRHCARPIRHAGLRSGTHGGARGWVRQPARHSQTTTRTGVSCGRTWERGAGSATHPTFVIPDPDPVATVGLWDGAAAPIQTDESTKHRRIPTRHVRALGCGRPMRRGAFYDHHSSAGLRCRYPRWGLEGYAYACTTPNCQEPHPGPRSGTALPYIRHTGLRSGTHGGAWSRVRPSATTHYRRTHEVLSQPRTSQTTHNDP